MARRSRVLSGQALAEFALILPLLLFVALGAIAIPLTIVHRSQLQHVAQELAIEAASTDCAAALTKADDLLGYRPQTATCEVQAQVVTVTLTHPFAALMPFLPSSITVTARALLR